MEVSVAEVAYLREYIALSEKWLYSAGSGKAILDEIKASLAALNEKYAAHSFPKRQHVLCEFEAREVDEEGGGWLQSRWSEC